MLSYLHRKMEKKLTRRKFLGYLAAAVPIPNIGYTSDLELRLHRTLPAEVKRIIPTRDLNLSAVEAMEEKENAKITPLGRFLRTYRWDRLLSSWEQKRNIEEGLLAGIVMQESYGDPLRLGPGNDAGLWMFIPSTARKYGLKISENPKELLSKYGRNYTVLAREDERFNIFKSTEAAIRLVSNLYGYLKDRVSSKIWDHAIAAYNKGPSARQYSNAKYVSSVRNWQEFYLVHKQLISSRLSRETLPEYIEASKSNFIIRDNKCYYFVNSGDVPSTIASRFNRKHETHYEKINWQAIKYNGVTVVPNRIFPSQKVYWDIKPVE
jgi:hypothetical protein